MRAAIAALACVVAFAAGAAIAQDKTQNANAQINYSGFRGLTDEVEAYRADRLVSLAEFHRMAADPNTIILDARSADAYARGHIDGAINLPFTDFTDASLRQALRDPNVRILIYCNNNFSNNAEPVMLKRVELALNIQTFINLYGYGYRNVYELEEVVDFNDPEVRWITS